MIGIKNRVGSPVRGNDFFGREKFVDLLWDKLMVGNLLLAALETDFYIRFKYEEGKYEFGSTLLRDWWLRHYSLQVS